MKRRISIIALLLAVLMVASVLLLVRTTLPTKARAATFPSRKATVATLQTFPNSPGTPPPAPTAPLTYSFTATRFRLPIIPKI